ncbi:hypothetical protein [Parasphingopyxis sp.]|uniref:hypothetical protein n=1 Tax=Parasphingopyxis sp. TaxID=1920299 RepID=UPI002639EC43|nr:hypothetical protein [Parasphingopyxis sp.]
MKHLLVIAATLLMASAPLRAADLATINCPLEGMTDIEVAGLVDYVVEQGDRDDPRAEPLSRAYGDCAARHGWSVEQGELVTMFTLSVVGQTGTERILAANDIDMSQIEQAVLNDAEFFAAIRSRDMSDAAIDAMVNRHLPLIEEAVSGHPDPEPFYETIGQFMMFRAMTEVAALQFAES